MSFRKLYYSMPASWRMIARKMYYLPRDVLFRIISKRHKYEPPKGDIYTGSGDFIQQGIHHLNLLIHYLDLLPSHHVLDIGCGIGRTAAALTSYMNSKGSYQGFDAVAKGIQWCQNTIGKDNINFKFKWIPLHNDLYTTAGKSSTDFIFPYEDNSFDRIFLFSVFTHMQPDEIAHYLNEIERVLKPGGQVLSTFFLYSKLPSEKHLGTKGFSFKIDKGDYWLMDAKVKSANIALSEKLLKRYIKESNLELLQIRHGQWNSDLTSTQPNDFQDIVILSKPEKL